ncbi:MAG: hypothetical protein ACRDWT_12470 [Jatrophihabitantaceae bacterium]
MIDQLGTVSRLPNAFCRGHCVFCGDTKAHHDRLLAVDQNVEEVMELFELAVTWGELDYSAQHLIAPSLWSAFVAAHRWRDADRAERIFGLATDVAAHSGQVRAGYLC